VVFDFVYDVQMVFLLGGLLRDFHLGHGRELELVSRYFVKN